MVDSATSVNDDPKESPTELTEPEMTAIATTSTSPAFTEDPSVIADGEQSSLAQPPLVCWTRADCALTAGALTRNETARIRKTTMTARIVDLDAPRDFRRIIISPSRKVTPKQT